MDIPNSVVYIGFQAFFSCGLVTVTIPNSVTSLGGSAFLYCSDLKSVIISNQLTYIAEKTFEGCNSLTSVTIPNSVTRIGKSAFSGCFKLSSITFGSSIKSIDDYAFSSHINLTELILPPSVETIGQCAFAGWDSKLASVNIGPNVKSIGQKAFDQCPVKAVRITAQTPPYVNNTTFSDYTGTLFVQGVYSINDYYGATYCWDKFAHYAMMTEPTEMVTTGSKTISGKPGDTFQLSAKLVPEDISLPYIFWRSTDLAVATVDANGLVTIGDPGWSYETLSCKIIAESLYADGPVAEFTVNNTSGIEDVFGVSDSDEIDFDAPVRVFTLQGVMVAESMDSLPAGIYIVRQGRAVQKIVIR